MTETLKRLITAAYDDRSLLAQAEYTDAVRTTIAKLDAGELRVAEPGETAEADWIVHAWVKQAILLYFGIQQLETIEIGPYEYFDKIPLKRGWAAAGVRVVPPATARYGSFIERGAEDFLHKPVNRGTVLYTVSRALLRFYGDVRDEQDDR